MGGASEPADAAPLGDASFSGLPPCMGGAGGPPDEDTEEEEEEAGVLEPAEVLLFQGLPPPPALGVGMADEEQGDEEEEEEEAGGWGAEVEDGMPEGAPAVTEGDGVRSVIAGCWGPTPSAGSANTG